MKNPFEKITNLLGNKDILKKSSEKTDEIEKVELIKIKEEEIEGLENIRKTKEYREGTDEQRQALERKIRFKKRELERMVERMEDES